LEKINVLTGLEERILQFVRNYCRSHAGQSPTLAEIGDGCGVKSVGTVHRYVSAIEGKGYLEKTRSGWRTRRPKATLPYRGVIVAGKPLEAVEQQDTIDLMDKLVQPGCFLLHVKGESMIDAGIFDGDLVVIQSSATARDGEIVVALVDGTDASLKEIRQHPAGKVELIPRNRNMAPMVYDAEQVTIQGVLRSVIRTY
jgi:repressor LexA